MIIFEDSRQQTNKHDLKHKWFSENGIEIKRTKLYCGDYTLPTNQSVCVDSKANMGEIYNNLIQDHNRIKAEADRAVEAGIKLYILIEEPDIKCLEDVKKWKNKRYEHWLRVNNAHKYGKMLNTQIPKKPPVNNITLMKIMSSFASKHGVEWIFCKPEEAGKRIVEILTDEKEIKLV